MEVFRHSDLKRALLSFYRSPILDDSPVAFPAGSFWIGVVSVGRGFAKLSLLGTLYLFFSSLPVEYSRFDLQ